jgi:hypothetical protein
MVSIADARKIALNLPQSIEAPHFHLASFRVNKKIFATIHEDKNYMMVKLSPVEQSVFCKVGEEVIFPVPGKWGLKGATFIDLGKVTRPLLKDALQHAWKKCIGRKY